MFFSFFFVIMIINQETNMYNNNNNYFIGRILDINDNTVTIFDGHSALKTFKLSDKPEFRCGDIVSLECQGGADKKSSADDFLLVSDYHIVCRCVDNPFNNPHSLPSRFMNESLSSVLNSRTEFMRIVAEFYRQHNYIRLDSPVLVDSPGVETYLEPFATDYYDYKAIAHRMYLPTSPEYALKSAVGATLSSVYSFARSFRNCGEESVLHKKEFTMLEWYAIFRDYNYLIEEMQEMMRFIGREYRHGEFNGILSRDGHSCDLNKCDVFTMKQLFAVHGIELDDYTDNSQRFIDSVSSFYAEKGESLSDNLNKDDYFFKFFMDYIEPTLGFDHPAIVKDFPIEMCPLSLPTADDARYGQRFEMYIFGIELANGYTELTDYETQKANFEIVLAERQRTGETEHVDQPNEFLQTLRYGIPPCAGCAMGFDRMFMLCEELSDIHKTDWY